MPPARRKIWAPWALAASRVMPGAGAWRRSGCAVLRKRCGRSSSRCCRPEKASFVRISLPALSPDGRHLAFAAGSEGKTQLLDSRSRMRSRPGPFPAPMAAIDPFWSPDSRFVAFFTSGKLKKIDIAGGPALTVCDAANGRGGSWSQSDVIVFTPSVREPLFRVPAAGGTATPLTALDDVAGESSHRFPWFLPDGRHFLFTVRSGNQQAAIYVGDLESPNVMGARPGAVFSRPPPTRPTHRPVFCSSCARGP